MQPLDARSQQTQTQPACPAGSTPELRARRALLAAIQQQFPTGQILDMAAGPRTSGRSAEGARGQAGMRLGCCGRPGSCCSSHCRSPSNHPRCLTGCRPRCPGCPRRRLPAPHLGCTPAQPCQSRIARLRPPSPAAAGWTGRASGAAGLRHCRLAYVLKRAGSSRVRQRTTGSTWAGASRPSVACQLSAAAITAPPPAQAPDSTGAAQVPHRQLSAPAIASWSSSTSSGCIKSIESCSVGAAKGSVMRRRQ